MHSWSTAESYLKLFCSQPLYPRLVFFSMPGAKIKYADPVVDLLDTSRVFRHRLFREHCVLTNGIYVKVKLYCKYFFPSFSWFRTLLYFINVLILGFESAWTRRQSLHHYRQLPRLLFIPPQPRRSRHLVVRRPQRHRAADLNANSHGACTQWFASCRHVGLLASTRACRRSVIYFIKSFINIPVVIYLYSLHSIILLFSFYNFVNFQSSM